MGELSWIAEAGVGWSGAIASGTLALEMLRDGLRPGLPLQRVAQG